MLTSRRTSNRFGWFVTGSGAASGHLAIAMAGTDTARVSDTVRAMADGIVVGTAVIVGDVKGGFGPLFFLASERVLL
jgi:hypothetical protein